MTETSDSNVSAAFDMLLETVETELANVNGFGMKSFEQRQYDKAKEAADRARRLSEFGSKLSPLRQEWTDLIVGGSALADQAAQPAPAEPQPVEQTPTEAEVEFADDPDQALPKDSEGKPIWEQKTTPEAEFYVPILEAVESADGACKEEDILDKLAETMGPKLNSVDLNPLPNGDAKTPIWRITAQWARTSLMKDGLIKVDPRKRVWEITDKGRSALPQKV